MGSRLVNSGTRTQAPGLTRCQIVGGIARDLSKSLGVIREYSEILEDQIGDDTTLTAIIGEIRIAVASAVALTARLSAFDPLAGRVGKTEVDAR